MCPTISCAIAVLLCSMIQRVPGGPADSASSHLISSHLSSLSLSPISLFTDMNETVDGKIDVMSSINTSLQNESATPAASKPNRITDLIPRNWEGSNDKGNFRHFLSDLHLWMQAWSDEGETMLGSVDGTDKFDNSAPVVDCLDARTIEASFLPGPAQNNSKGTH